MPLRDHFHPPLDLQLGWEEFHAGWPMVIVQQLRNSLPPGYVAGPHVHLGSAIEIDIGTFEDDRVLDGSYPADESGGVATAVWAPAIPSVDVETELADLDDFEIRIYDVTRGRQLVAAIEIVSPANKDRPKHRELFVAKCAGLLQKQVAVSIVDLVTRHQFNLYLELLNLFDIKDRSFAQDRPEVYAISCRMLNEHKRHRFQSWAYGMKIGDPLPTLPLWLTDRLAIPLKLEESYEKACHDLWIR